MMNPQAQLNLYSSCSNVANSVEIKILRKNDIVSRTTINKIKLLFQTCALYNTNDVLNSVK